MKKNYAKSTTLGLRPQYSVVAKATPFDRKVLTENKIGKQNHRLESESISCETNLPFSLHSETVLGLDIVVRRQLVWCNSSLLLSD